MSNQSAFASNKERLEEIVVQVRSKDVPLEKSLDLYDEALALGAKCVEQLEHTDFTAEELELASEHPDVELSGAVVTPIEPEQAASNSTQVQTNPNADPLSTNTAEASDESA